MSTGQEGSFDMPSAMASIIGVARLSKMDDRQAAIVWAAIEDEVNSNQEIREILAKKVKKVLKELGE